MPEVLKFALRWLPWTQRQQSREMRQNTAFSWFRWDCRAVSEALLDGGSELILNREILVVSAFLVAMLRRRLLKSFKFDSSSLCFSPMKRRFSIESLERSQSSCQGNEFFRNNSIVTNEHLRPFFLGFRSFGRRLCCWCFKFFYESSSALFWHNSKFKRPFRVNLDMKVDSQRREKRRCLMPLIKLIGFLNSPSRLRHAINFSSRHERVQSENRKDWKDFPDFPLRISLLLSARWQKRL